MTRGYGMPTPNESSRFLISPGFMPETAIRMRTSPGPGRGSGISPTTNTSRGCPCFSYQAALIKILVLYEITGQVTAMGGNRLSSGNLRPLKHCRPGHGKQFLLRCPVPSLNRHALHDRHIKLAQRGCIRTGREFSVPDTTLNLGGDAHLCLNAATPECGLQVGGLRRAVYGGRNHHASGRMVLGIRQLDRRGFEKPLDGVPCGCLPVEDAA